MAFSDQYEQDYAMGCVCDFDTDCPTHGSVAERGGSCPTCEYACHCEEHDFRSKECGEECSPSPREAWLADYREMTDATALEAELAYERFVGQQS